jgi:hypothetical protein
MQGRIFKKIQLTTYTTFLSVAESVSLEQSRQSLILRDVGILASPQYAVRRKNKNPATFGNAPLFI